MRFLIVGAGATGGYFGGRLAASGADVTFLVRPERAERLSRQGLTILSPAAGDVTIVPKTVTLPRLTQQFDCVLIAVKAYGLEEVLASLAPAIDRSTMILPLLNGMRHIDSLIERFGKQTVLGGVCHIGATLDSQGRILHLGTAHGISFGELGGTASARLRQLEAAFAPAAFDAHGAGEIVLEMWEKWVGLAALAVLTCLLRGAIGEINTTPWGAELAEQAAKECASIATANGFAPRPAFLSRLHANLTQPNSAQTCSLYRDLINGAPVESDHVLADLLARGGQTQPRPIMLPAAAAQLAIYNARRQISVGKPAA